MGRDVIQACIPWLVCLAAAAALGWLLLRANRSRLRLHRLRMLHRNESGSAQSLSFVLTLPLFIMVLLLIVQISQLMIGTVVVHYAAYAAARSAAVWIPAGLAHEGPNCIAYYFPDVDAPGQSVPILDPEDPGYGPGEGGMTFVIGQGGPKWERIHLAAVLACMPISPSRDAGIDLPSGAGRTSDVLRAAYESSVRSAAGNARSPVRLRNKLAYSIEATQIEMRFYHTNREPPLVAYAISPDLEEFRHNELGWQDAVTVTVHHQLALLPGPGRMLARYVPGPGGGDRVSERIDRLGNVYVYPLSASAIMSIEGEKPLVAYHH